MVLENMDFGFKITKGGGFMRKSFLILALVVFFVSFTLPGAARSKMSLWDVYENFFVNAKYVDLTHAITPDIPIWVGFGPTEFFPTRCGRDMGDWASKGDVFNYEDHGFVATGYRFTTDQTEKEADYHCTLADVKAWEDEHGAIPEGSVVMVRSDQSKKWENKEEFEAHLPGVNLDAIKYLHETRHILFHGHECLDTDTTGAMIGETWILHHNYCQAEGVSNLWMVPEAGALIAIGFPKLKGGVGGYARYIAICPPDWKYGESVAENMGAPLPEHKKPLRWDKEKGMRVR